MKKIYVVYDYNSQYIFYKGYDFDEAIIVKIDAWFDGFDDVTMSLMDKRKLKRLKKRLTVVQ